MDWGIFFFRKNLATKNLTKFTNSEGKKETYSQKPKTNQRYHWKNFRRFFVWMCLWKIFSIQKVLSDIKWESFEILSFSYGFLKSLNSFCLLIWKGHELQKYRVCIFMLRQEVSFSDQCSGFKYLFYEWKGLTIPFSPKNSRRFDSARRPLHHYLCISHSSYLFCEESSIMQLNNWRKNKMPQKHKNQGLKVYKAQAFAIFPPVWYDLTLSKVR